MDLLVNSDAPDYRGGLQWVQTRLPAPRGLVFIPPLIGGGPAQQLGTFRWLARQNLDLFTFNFSGHGGSAGKFSLDTTLDDTRHMLALAANRAESDGLPLYGISACYSTIPMLYGAMWLHEPFKRIVLINPLTALFQRVFLRALWGYCKAGFDLKNPLHSVNLSIDKYLESFFPNISRSLAGFGTLSRKRTRLLKVLFEWFSSGTDLDFSLPGTPALCVYGKRDPLLNLGGSDLWSTSQDCLRRICSPVTFHAIDSDHFLSDPGSRQTVRQAISSFLLTG